MKTNKRIKSAVSMLVQTTSYRIKQIDYKIQHDEIIIWSIDKEGNKRDSFFATELCNIFSIFNFSNYISIKEGTICLTIF